MMFILMWIILLGGAALLGKWTAEICEEWKIPIPLRIILFFGVGACWGYNIVSLFENHFL